MVELQIEPWWYALRPQTNPPYVKALRWGCTDESTKAIIDWVGDDCFKVLETERFMELAALWNEVVKHDHRMMNGDYVIAYNDGSGFYAMDGESFDEMYS